MTVQQPSDYQAGSQAFVRLLEIMDTLREHCPWDRKQTFESLRHLSIEEVYELSEAILAGDAEAIKGELGDLLMHMTFYARLGTEGGSFSIADVLHQVCDKLIRRHPHIYGEVQVSGADEVKANWEEIKLREKGNQGVLSGVPAGLPALVKAYRIQEKVAAVGFDWPSAAPVLAKVYEELAELEAERLAAHHDNMEAEMGDVFFALINYARHLGLNPEDALERSNRKFIQRFQHVEAAAKAQGQALKNMTLAQLDELWAEAKQ